MNSSQDDQLDRLLTTWATKTASSEEDLEALRKAIRRGSDDVETPPGVELARLLQKSHNRWRIVAGLTTAAAAAAAVLLITIGTWYRTEPNGTEGSGLKPLSHALAQYPHPLPKNTLSTDTQLRIWQEHRRVFGSELAWIADRDGQTEIGLTDPSVRSNFKELIAVRLVLWSRPTNNGQWQEVESFHVMSGREELVQVASSGEDSTPLEIWVYPLDQELVSIDLIFRPNLPDAPTLKQSVLQSMGEYTQVADFEKNGVEYRLYQTAEVLDEIG